MNYNTLSLDDFLILDEAEYLAMPLSGIPFAPPASTPTPRRSIGWNPHRMAELTGGAMIEVWNHEPDAQTFRQDYYYNSRTNQLFRRMSRGSKPKQRYWVASHSD